MRVQYIQDQNVSQALDVRLRTLLSICYREDPDIKILSVQRYFSENPQHRYILWDGDELIAHIAVHDKKVLVSDKQIPICGIADVCVHPQYRKQGLVKRLLDKVHVDRLKYGDAFSILFGDKDVYASSGYQCADNLLILSSCQEWRIAKDAMVFCLNKTWPVSEVKLIGIAF